MPEELHEQRSLAVYSPWGRKKLDMTEQLNNNDLLIFAVKSDSDILKISHLIKKKTHNEKKKKFCFYLPQVFPIEGGKLEEGLSMLIMLYP